MENAKAKEAFIDNYCTVHNYQVNKKVIAHGIKLEISNLSEKVSLIVYSSGKVVPEGNPNSLLRKEFDTLKSSIDQNPELLRNIGVVKSKSCSQKYIIVQSDLQDAIKEALNQIEANTHIEQAKVNHESYRAKVSRNPFTLTIIQYNNGTLLIQGKQDKLFDDICTLIEKIAKPSNSEIIIRFIADEADALDKFNATFNPELLNRAEASIKAKVGSKAFNFLEDHDKKYLIASECLRISQIPLPEFSPVVMPASKTFEGFVKKLLLSIGFYPANHFTSKSSSFAYLNEKNHPNRAALVNKEKYAATYLDKISLCLDEYRNFMMHSDSSSVTKVNSLQDAESKLDDIAKNIKQIFDYFKNNPFGI